MIVCIHSFLVPSGVRKFLVERRVTLFMGDVSAGVFEERLAPAFLMGFFAVVFAAAVSMDGVFLGENKALLSLNGVLEGVVSDGLFSSQ
jgi:hypothetical protein